MKYAISVKNLLTKIVAPSIIIRIPFVHRKHARQRRFLFEIMKSVVLVRGCKYSKTSKIVFLKLQTQIISKSLFLKKEEHVKMQRIQKSYVSFVVCNSMQHLLIISTIKGYGDLKRFADGTLVCGNQSLFYLF